MHIPGFKSDFEHFCQKINKSNQAFLHRRTERTEPYDICDPIGIRIQVPRMRIWCPRPLDDGAKTKLGYYTKLGKKVLIGVC